MPTKHSKISINFEMVIVIIIACCMLFLNFFTTSKLKELERSSDEAMFIRNDLPFMNCDELTEEILDYKPDACKMIELYDEQFNLMFMIQFDPEMDPGTYDIKDYPELIEMLSDREEGQVNIQETADNYEEDVYFQWLDNANGERRLIMIYSTKPVVENVWVFSLVCYLVLVMVFLLLIRLYLKQYHTRIKEYEATSKEMRDRINND